VTEWKQKSLLGCSAWYIKKYMASISFFTFSFSTFVEVNDFPIMLSDDNQENTQTKCKMHIHKFALVVLCCCI
jgi:hypothetical protein